MNWLKELIFKKDVPKQLNEKDQSKAERCSFRRICTLSRKDNSPVSLSLGMYSEGQLLPTYMFRPLMV